MRRTRGTPWRAEWLWLLLLTGLLLLGVWWLPGRSGVRSDTFSAAHDGKKGFYEVVRRLRSDVERNDDLLVGALDDIGTLVLLGPARQPSPREWSALYEWVADGGCLLFAPRTEDVSVDLGPFGVVIGEVERIDANGQVIEPRSAGDAEVGGAGGSGDTTNHGVDSDIEGIQDLLSALPIRTSDVETEVAEGEFRWLSRGWIRRTPLDSETILGAKGTPQAVKLWIGAGTAVILASEEVFANRSIARRDRDGWLLAHRLLDAVSPEGGAAPGPVVFDESLNAEGTPKVLGVLFNPSLRRLTLQALVLVAIFCWWGSRRFGPAEPSEEAPRRSIREHAMALGNLHFKAGTGAQAVARYLDFFRREAGLQAYARRGDGASEDTTRHVASLLARWVGMEQEDVLEALRRAERAAEARRVAAGEAAAIIRSLATILAKLEHRKGNGNGA